MTLKKVVAVFDNLIDFEDFMAKYKDGAWTLIAEHIYIHPFKDEYIHTYLLIYVKEVPEGKEE